MTIGCLRRREAGRERERRGSGECGNELHESSGIRRSSGAAGHVGPAAGRRCARLRRRRLGRDGPALSIVARDARTSRVAGRSAARQPHGLRGVYRALMRAATATRSPARRRRGERGVHADAGHGGQRVAAEDQRQRFALPRAACRRPAAGASTRGAWRGRREPQAARRRRATPDRDASRVERRAAMPRTAHGRELERAVRQRERGSPCHARANGATPARGRRCGRDGCRARRRRDEARTRASARARVQLVEHRRRAARATARRSRCWRRNQRSRLRARCGARRGARSARRARASRRRS